MTIGTFSDSGLRLRPVTSFAEHIAGSVSSETAMVQLGRGDLSLETLRATGRDVQLVCLWVHTQFSGYVALPKDWTAIVLPLVWEGSVVANAREVDLGDIFISRGNGYAGYGLLREHLIVNVRTSRLCATLARISGKPDDRFSLPETHIRLNSLGADQCCRKVLAQFHRAKRDGRGSLHLNGVIEQDVLDVLARTLLSALGHDDVVGQSRPSVDIVLQSLRGADHSIRMPMIEHLCRSAGVGRTKLFESFAKTFGTSPNIVIGQLRLARAREVLLMDHGPVRSVKDVQLKLGFSNSGRFAADYRRLFGESPKDTLRTGRLRRTDA